MKKLVPVFLLMFLLTVTHAIAQTAADAATTEEESNCYLKWAKKFEERGGYDVRDSIYNDVIISFRRGTKADCFAGKVEIIKGKIVNIWLKQEGNSYELFSSTNSKEKKYKITNEMTVVSGVSTTLVTTDDELVNVIFYRQLKPKKKGLVKAPDPVTD